MTRILAGIKEDYDADGLLRVSLVQSFVINEISLTDIGNVGIGGASSVLLFADAGNVFVFKTMDLKASAPPFATSGFHQFTVLNSDGDQYTIASSVFGSNLEYRHGKWFIADNTQSPTTEIAQLEIVRSMYAGEASEIIFRYDNITDVVQTSTRFMSMTVLVVSA